MLVDVAIPRTKLDFLTYRTDLELAVGDLVSVPLRGKEKSAIVVNTDAPGPRHDLKKVNDILVRGYLSANIIKFYRWIAEYYLGTLGEVLTLAMPGKGAKKDDGFPLSREAAGPVPVLTGEQGHALAEISAALDRNRYEAFLLWGITGSGKTEVYIRAIERVLAGGGRALVMVPEISMTSQLRQRLGARFGADVASIHSSLPDRERARLWSDTREGKYRIVIGPRSAVFLPVPELKIIIVDEEHDPSYKEQERQVRYNGRDAAVMRARIENIAVILGSATPQIETYYNTQTGKYRLLNLTRRIDDRPLPQVRIVDLRQERKKFVSSVLEQKIIEKVEKKEQAIIFLNRRGFAPSLLCPNCGFTAQCPMCRLPLVYHRTGKPHLACHVCIYRTAPITICPQCGKVTLLYRGAGTQRIEEIVRKIVGNAGGEGAVLRLDRDAVRKKGAADRILGSFDSGCASILLGTQLVTKGFDFPRVTLVGVINADAILNLPDFRSGERTFQVLTQVAGRSGRGSIPGEVVVQTYHPDQYAILFGRLQDYPRFYDAEIKARRELEFPPFTKLVLVTIRGEDEEQVWSDARRIGRLVDRIAGIKKFGPNRSYYYRVRNQYRVQLLLKTALNFRRMSLSVLKNRSFKKTRIELDVDPVGLF